MDWENPYVGEYAGQLRRRAGHVWMWTTEGPFRPHWRSSSGKDVRVFPPRRRHGEWMVGVREGDDADGFCTTLPPGEKKAFAFAERLRSGEVETPVQRPKP